VHLVHADNDDEHTLLMASFCALHNVEVEEKTEEAAKAEHESVLAIVDLDEPHA
jgi:hypothetical protein